MRTPAADTRSDPACAWCGAPLHVGAVSGTVPCPRCGARTTWPIPTDAELERAYGSWYRPKRGRFSGVGDHVLRRLRGRTARRLNEIAPPGPILDVGAGDGALLDALNAVGRTAVGLERHAMRDDIREAEIRDVEGHWAGIVFWHSLEHLRDAGVAVDCAAGLLEPGGALVVAMPNPASLQARLFGDRWFALDLPRHLVHVPAGALLERLRDTRPPSYPRQLSAWRSGRLRLAPRLRRDPAVAPGSLRRHPPARGAPSGALSPTTHPDAGDRDARSAAGRRRSRGRGAARRGGTIYVEAHRA